MLNIFKFFAIIMAQHSASKLIMKHVSAILSALFHRSASGDISYITPSPMDKKVFRNFSLQEARNGKPFQLRGGMPFEAISLDHHVDDDPRPRVLIEVKGQPLKFCYYDDGIWNENEYSDYDLVMID